LRRDLALAHQPERDFSDLFPWVDSPLVTSGKALAKVLAACPRASSRVKSGKLAVRVARRRPVLVLRERSFLARRHDPQHTAIYSANTR